MRHGENEQTTCFLIHTGTYVLKILFICKSKRHTAKELSHQPVHSPNVHYSLELDQEARDRSWQLSPDLPCQLQNSSKWTITYCFPEYVLVRSWKGEQSWDSHSGTPTWNAGVSNGILSTRPKTCPDTHTHVCVCMYICVYVTFTY